MDLIYNINSHVMLSVFDNYNIIFKYYDINL